MLNELQKRWLQNQLIGIDVIVKDSGHVKLIDITYTHNENLIDTFKKSMLFHTVQILHCLNYCKIIRIHGQITK